MRAAPSVAKSARRSRCYACAMRLPFAMALAATLVACQSLPRAPARKAAAAPPPTAGIEAGTYDNHEQLWLAHEQGTAAPPHLSLDIQPTPQAEWTLWHVHVDAQPPLDAVWAMRAAGPGGRLLPHAPIAGLAAPFDVRAWAPLPACELREAHPGNALAADVAACAASIATLGAQGALLPTAVEPGSEGLRLRLYADEARGAQAQSQLHRVATFGGWAVVNGAGANAKPNGDWHMNSGMRIGSEGGRRALVWRDGKPTGYSLSLERVTYRQGNVPVLKLAVVDDASGQSLAYVWANPEATRIGLNFGWVQVGLEREAATLPP